jgi:spore maturation protein SpmB
MIQILKRGIISGWQTTWKLTKIIFPISLSISLLSYTPVLKWMMELISPVLKLIGLPGDAAIPIVLGATLNLYAAIGAMFNLTFTVKEAFIIAIIVSFCHNLFVETGVAAKLGVKVRIVLGVRVGLALLTASLIHLLWQGGSEIAQYSFLQQHSESVVTGFFPIIWHSVSKSLTGIWQMAKIVMPLMIVIQCLRDFGWLEKISKGLAPAMRFLGLKENTSLTLAAGLTIGLAYGAGVMMQAVEVDGVSKKDITVIVLILVSCHAVIEDTLLFVPIGIPILPLFLIRVFVALTVAMMASRFIR